MGMPLLLTRAVEAYLLEQAAAALPHECCGLLLGDYAGYVSEARPAANVADDPSRHFEIDPAVLIAAHRAQREGGRMVIGYYHSHPNGSPDPSPLDRASAAGDGLVWAIIARGEIFMWRDEPQRGFKAAGYRLSD